MDAVESYAESIVLELLDNPQAITKIKNILGTDNYTKYMQLEVLKALADYSCNITDSDLIEIIKPLVLSLDCEIAFFSAHALAVCNLQEAIKMLNMLNLQQDSCACKMAKNAIISGMGDGI